MMIFKSNTFTSIDNISRTAIRLQTECKGEFWQRFPRCSDLDWDLNTKLTVLVSFSVSECLRSVCSSQNLACRQNILATRFLAKYSTNAGTYITPIQCMASMPYLLPSCRLNDNADLSFLWRILFRYNNAISWPLSLSVVTYPDNNIVTTCTSVLL